MTDTEYRRRIFEQLDALEDHYRWFTRTAFGAIAILSCAVLYFLVVALPHKTEQIQRSRHAALIQVCEDQKTLLALVPADYPPLTEAIRRHPNSSLNPNRDCQTFARRATR